MKKLIILAALAMSLTPALAQQQTLFDGKLESGGFGGPAVQLTSLDGKAGLLVGGGGAWFVNHTFMLGGFGYGLANNIRCDYLPADSSRYMEFGYGGVYLGYVHGSDQVVHFTASALIGGGSFRYRYRSLYDFNDNEIDRSSEFPYDTFFIIEPILGVEVNVLSYFRIELTGRYRFVSAVDLYGLSNSDLNGPSAGLFLKFGSF